MVLLLCIGIFLTLFKPTCDVVRTYHMISNDFGEGMPDYLEIERNTDIKVVCIFVFIYW